MDKIEFPFKTDEVDMFVDEVFDRSAGFMEADEFEQFERGLLAALTLFTIEYLPPADQKLFSLSVLSSMFCVARTNCPGNLIFKELMTGERPVRRFVDNTRTEGTSARKMPPSWDTVPSTFRRNSDGAQPYEHVKQDGSRGFDAKDDECTRRYLASFDLIDNNGKRVIGSRRLVRRLALAFPVECSLDTLNDHLAARDYHRILFNDENEDYWNRWANGETV